MAKGWVYVVLDEDHRTDVEPYVFTHSDEAIEFAKELAEEKATDPDDIEEEDIEGWLYYVQYHTEGDFIRVQTVEVDEYAPEQP